MSKTTNADAEVLAMVTRIEQLHAEKSDLDELLRALYSEAKGSGFDTNALKTVVKRRRAEPEKLAEADAMLDLYLAAIDRADGKRKPSRTREDDVDESHRHQNNEAAAAT